MAEAASRLHAALAGRYEGRQELGVGGMATVDLAHEVTHDRDVVPAPGRVAAGALDPAAGHPGERQHPAFRRRRGKPGSVNPGDQLVPGQDCGHPALPERALDPVTSFEGGVEAGDRVGH